MITYLLVCHDVVTQTVLQDTESVICFLILHGQVDKHATYISTGQLIKCFSLSLSSYDDNNKYMSFCLSPFQVDYHKSHITEWLTDEVRNQLNSVTVLQPEDNVQEDEARNLAV